MKSAPRTPRDIRVQITAVLGLIVLCAGPGHARAQEKGSQKALLIAVQNYDDKKLSLTVTLRDSLELGRVLQDRAGIPRASITMMNDEASPPLQPRLENVRRELKTFLADARPEDRILIFFSGHGFIAPDGRTYLVPADFVLNEPEKTGLPASEIRDLLNACKSTVKFLILDCCQAGGDKAIDEPTAAPGAVAKGLSLKSVPNCLVLASCQADEKSYEWPERKQSVFTYWLCQALEGGADKDANGRITFEEVYEYCNDRVPRTVEKLFDGRTQSPAREVGLRARNTDILTLEPDTPESLCSRLAMLMDLEARERDLKSVGVLEFHETLGNIEALNRANLPAYCSEKVRLELASRAGSAYRVLDEEETRKAAAGLTLADLGDPSAMQRLGKEGKGIDAIISGRLKPRAGQMVVACEMIETSTGEPIASPAGLSMPMTENLLADQGRSFDIRERGEVRDTKKPVAVLEQAVAESTKANPLLKPDFPYSVEVYSVMARPGEAVTPRTPRQRKPLYVMPGDPQAGVRPDPNSLVFGATKGEQLEIWIRNRSNAPVGVALLVDGINTLGQERALVKDARLWVLRPMQLANVGGWYLSRPGESKVMTKKDFIITGVAHSVAGRQKFGDALGTVTAAFFTDRVSRGKPITIGVGAGRESVEAVKETKFNRDKLQGVINLRYTSQDALRGLVPVATR